MTVHVVVSVDIESDDYEEAIQLAISDVTDFLPIGTGMNWVVGSPADFGYATPSK